MDSRYSIQQLAREFAVTPRALRFYEDKGLITPARRGQTRLYSDRDRTRLRLALRGKRLGFSLEECREIIDMYNPKQSGGPRQLLRLCDKIREHRADLLQKLRDVEATLGMMGEVEAKCLAALLQIDVNGRRVGR